MKYICEFYIPVENNEERYYAISACDKATYLFSVLNRLGYDVEVISPSYSKKRSKQRIDRLNNKVTITSGFSLGWNGRITKFFAKLSTMVWLLFFLLFKCKKGELVIDRKSVV